MRSGLPLSHLISLASGFPDANISWAVDGVNQTAITPPVGAVSVTLEVSALTNTLANGSLLGLRTLTWSYAVGGLPVSGSHKYQLEGEVPFLATEQGVRNQLGLENSEDLPDEDISIVRGYLEFQNYVGAAALAAVASGTDYQLMLVSEGIEAQTALRILPALQLRVAQSETSGTNQFARGKMDWDKLEASLAAKVSAAATVVNPALDPLTVAAGRTLLLLVTPSTDLFPDG